MALALINVVCCWLLGLKNSLLIRSFLVALYKEFARSLLSLFLRRFL